MYIYAVVVVVVVIVVAVDMVTVRLWWLVAADWRQNATTCSNTCCH